MVKQHILSFDVENWFDGNLHRNWTYQDNRQDDRVAWEIYDLLDLLAQNQTHATFFILGQVAQSHPHLVRAIAAAGHEIASHGLVHLLVRDRSPEDFAADLKASRALLQDLSGQPVLGHRAPSWSIDDRTPWAVEALLAAGYAYDSSIFPMKTPLYGHGRFPNTPFWLAHGGARLLEVPPAVYKRGPISIPYGGGLYWRALPACLIRHLLRCAPTVQMTYLHPWELNPNLIEVPSELPIIPHIALRHGVKHARHRLAHLLRIIRFAPAAEHLPTWTQNANLPTVHLGGGST